MKQLNGDIFGHYEAKQFLLNLVRSRISKIKSFMSLAWFPSLRAFSVDRPKAWVDWDGFPFLPHEVIYEDKASAECGLISSARKGWWESQFLLKNSGDVTQ